MPNPYLLTALVYFLLAFLGALDASLTSFEIIPAFTGLRWMRVHLITLGILVQVIFAVLPRWVAEQNKKPEPKFRLDIWIALNAGVVALLYGIPQINTPSILAGGGLVFTATALQVTQLYQLRALDGNLDSNPDSPDPRSGRRFYLAGLGYFFLGIIIGTGLWLGWPGILRIANPIEVHIHANNFGLLSLVFAGLIVDNFSKISGLGLAWPGSIRPIFWLMSLGALGLVLGPWFDRLYFTAPGLILYLAGTVWLLLNLVRPLWGRWERWTPGIGHLVVSYSWLLAPIALAPLLALGAAGLPVAAVEGNAPQALIYGWGLQVGYAFVPYFYRRMFFPGQDAALGGSWISFVLVNLGCALLWLGIFIEPAYGILHGSAYILWAISMLPIVRELWEITRQGFSLMHSKPLADS